MSIIKTEGIITRVMNYLESSKIITCYTPDAGKVTVLAKGARRAKSRFGGTLDLLQHVQLVYYEKETRELQTLSQVDMIHSFNRLQENLPRLSFGLAAAELINKLEITNEANPLFFKQSLEFYLGLEDAESPELLLHQFILRWMKNAGFQPKLRRCIKCGQIPQQSPVHFLLTQGGYACNNCKGNNENSLKITIKCLKLLLYLRDGTVQQAANLKISNSLLHELRNFSWRYLFYYSEGIHQLKSLEFLKRLLGNNSKSAAMRS
jgi:DNA repair protein RecO (recombination protein O)